MTGDDLVAKPRGVPACGLVMLALAALAFFAFGYAGWHLLADWMPDSTTRQLQGATMQEVRDLLGEPTHTDQGEDGTIRWAFRRDTRMAVFHIDFSANGTVTRFSYDR